MARTVKNNSITAKDLDNLADRLDKGINIKLGKFTDDVLLPGIKNIVSDETGKLRHELKNYIDDKLAETKGDIISFIKGDQERDKNWKLKVVNILKRENLIKSGELKILIDLLR